MTWRPIPPQKAKGAGRTSLLRTDAGLPDQEASRALLGAAWIHLWKGGFLPTT